MLRAGDSSPLAGAGINAAAHVAPTQGAGAAGAGIDAAAAAQPKGAAEDGVEEERLEHAVEAAANHFDAFHGNHSFRGVYMQL